MAVTLIKPSFASGELAPSLFGRVDLAKWHQGASTMRNMFVNYRGGATSRAGTAWVGQCKQSGSAAPPRDIRFQFSLNQGYVLEFGEQYMRVKFEGAYVTENPTSISNVTQANPAVVTDTAHGYANGDWVFISNVGGMTQLNGLTFIVANKTTNTYQLTDLFGNVIDSTNYSAYTSGGNAARIFTLVTPYAAADLPLLKYTQSADVMSLTHQSYQPYELSRLAAANWTLTPATFTASINAPTNPTCFSTNTDTSSTQPACGFAYVITAIDSVTKEESVASPICSVTDSVDIAVVQGSILLNWSPPTGGGGIPAYYNIYKAPAAPGIRQLGNYTFAGSFFGYAGSSYSTTFVDDNIVQDFTVTPPLHLNPFAPGAILNVTITNAGSGYTTGQPTAHITTSTGSGAVLQPIVSNGVLTGVIVQNGGQNYKPTNTITISGAGGSGATAKLNVGPQTGTYPGCVAYFQERRFYGSTANNPDTYYASQPGAFLNFDSATPPVDSDAITGTPWAVQVNGIQSMVPMPGGLVILTGSGAWQLNGGATGAAVTPADQLANPQAGIGCSPTVQPIVINYDVLYVQSKGSIIRDLQYNFFFSIYTGNDLTVLSSHLFANHQIVQWAYSEEPFKVVWCARDDGILLSLTYLKEQEVYGWARHDTNGVVVSVVSVTEPPVDAIYLIVKRYIIGQNQWVYYSERMDDRLWDNVEEAWCVDAGLALPQPTRNATLSAASATGDSGIGSVHVVAGGSGYSSPTIQVIDPTGSGAMFSVGVSGGVITSITPTTFGTGYTQPVLTILDATGSGAVVTPVIEHFVIFTASAPVFTAGDVGSVIRMGGGIATVTQFISSTQVLADLRTPIAAVILDDPNSLPLPATTGTWTITAPVSSVTGLRHLEGMEVSILADGSPIDTQIVTGGTVTLDAPASQITVGLPFLPQLQMLNLDIQGAEGTVQGKRKLVSAVTVRVEDSRGFSVGSNEPDQSIQPNNATVPWSQMVEWKQRSVMPNAGDPLPLFTGDARINLPGTWRKGGQVAIQQNYPLPLTVLAVMPEVTIGDSNG